MTIKKVSTFETEDSDGKKMNLVVKYPTPQQFKDAQLVSIRAFKSAIEAGAITREGLEQYMEENGMWGDKQKNRVLELSKLIAEGEKQLSRGGRTLDGKTFTKEDGRKLAVDMRVWRMEQITLLASTSRLDSYTVQGQSENAKFDFLVSQCTYDEEKRKVFSDYNDYISKSDEPFAMKAASELATMLHDYDPKFANKFPENKFLLEYGFARDTDLRLVDKEGHLVNSDNERLDIVEKPEEFTPFADDAEVVAS